MKNESFKINFFIGKFDINSPNNNEKNCGKRRLDGMVDKPR